MPDILSKKSILIMYQNNRQDFDMRSLKGDGVLCISKEPVFLNGASFIMTMFYGVEGLEHVSMVATAMQSDDRYRGLKPGHIHDAWLKDTCSSKGIMTQFGIKYAENGYEVYSEHDKFNHNDVILIRYKNQPADDGGNES